MIFFLLQLQADCAVLGKNMPKVAGNLKWSQELRSRILQNRNNLCQMAHLYEFFFVFVLTLNSRGQTLFHRSSRPLECAEADNVVQKYEHLLERLKQHDEELFTGWTQGVEEICEKHLQEPLLTLDTDMGLYQVNFSFAVRTDKKSSSLKR